MFYKDEDGHHYFVSRRDDLIKIKGEKVSPIEIEAIVNQMPNMEAAIATVVPDEMNGHAIVLHVIIDNASTRDIMFYCKKNLEKELMPKKIVFWDEFPLVEGSNKIDRVALKQHGLKEIGL